MLRLILFRHGKAEPARPGYDDHARALAPRGWDDCPRVMRSLMVRGITPELVLFSDARRCMETRESLDDMLSGVPTQLREDLYLAESDILMTAASEAARDHAANCIMIIAHNPGVQLLSSLLAPIGEANATELRRKFPTGSAASFSRDDQDAPWRLDAFVRPTDVSFVD